MKSSLDLFPAFQIKPPSRPPGPVPKTMPLSVIATAVPGRKIVDLSVLPQHRVAAAPTGDLAARVDRLRCAVPAVQGRKQDRLPAFCPVHSTDSLFFSGGSLCQLREEEERQPGNLPLVVQRPRPPCKPGAPELAHVHGRPRGRDQRGRLAVVFPSTAGDRRHAERNHEAQSPFPLSSLRLPALAPNSFDSHGVASVETLRSSATSGQARSQCLTGPGQTQTHGSRTTECSIIRLQFRLQNAASSPVEETKTR